MDQLAPNFHVLAPDSYGAGKSPAWPSDARIGLRDEAALLEPVFLRAGEPMTLVGHSYGGAVALVAATLQPQRVRALVLYEPTLFALIEASSSQTSEAAGIRQAVKDAAGALEAGDRSAAAGHFIDYWMGLGAWQHTPEARRGPIEAAIVNVRGWADALMGEPTSLATIASLRMPVLLMTGRDSPASSRAVARVLAQALPHAERIDFEGLGHMGPITHPGVVNAAIESFLRR